MTIFERLTRLLGMTNGQQSTHESSEPGTTSQENITIIEEEQFQENTLAYGSVVEYRGRKYYCQVIESPNSEYQVRYAEGDRWGEESVPGAVFLSKSGTPIFAAMIECPNEIAVSNSGIVAIIDWGLGWDSGLGGTFHIYDQTGSVRVVETFSSELCHCAVTADGQYAAVSTFKPDCSLYLFDVEKRKLLSRHEIEDSRKLKLSFELIDNEWCISFAESERGQPEYAIDLSGNVVWRYEKGNLREDIQELVEQVKHGDSDYYTDNDLCTIARQNPEEITPHLSALLNLLEDGMFTSFELFEGQLTVPVESAFTSVANAAPEEYEAQLDRLVENICGATTPSAAIVSTSVLECLAQQELSSLEPYYDDCRELLHHERCDVRRRAVTILESGAGQVYDLNPIVADELVNSLQSEEDVGILWDLTSALITLLTERPSAIERMEPAVPRAIELLTLGDADYQWGHVQIYDYKDQIHYNTNHLHRTVPSLITKLAPKYADQLTDAIPILLTLLSQPGHRNTRLRSASRQALVQIVHHSTGAYRPVLESEFDRIVTLLEHKDTDVQVAALELLVALGSADARRQLSTLQDHADEELASIAFRALQIIDVPVSLSPEVARLMPSGDDAIERQQNRIAIQRAYEFLKTKGRAQKRDFIAEVYSDNVVGNEERWWRKVRSGLASIETVERSGNTYGYIGER